MSELDRLGQAVFSFIDCPSWAVRAVVDKDGRGFWFAVKVELLSIEDEEWMAPMDGDFFGKCQSIGFSWTRFDASDWQNSAIDRDEAA